VPGYELRQEIASFVLAFDSNMFPIVGQETTLTSEDASAVAARIALLESQASAGNTDLIARGSFFGRDIGFTYQNGAWLADTAAIGTITDGQLRALVGFLTPALTFTAVPPGEGLRLGVDRDGDGYADGDEIAAGTDPANPRSFP